MQVYLLDGTYELFRHYFGVPPHRDADGNQAGAVVGVVGSVLRMIEDGVTHLGVATDHVVESFRNDLWPGYKTGEGVEPALRRQFEPLEQALSALGLRVWAMVELEADDALASAALRASEDPAVDRVVIATPDKDLGQCVRGRRVVQLDRRSGTIPRRGRRRGPLRRAARVDPRLPRARRRQRRRLPRPPRAGARSRPRPCSRATATSRLSPRDAAAWDVTLRGAPKLARRRSPSGGPTRCCSATSPRSAPRRPSSTPSTSCAGTGPRPEFEELARRLRSPGLLARARAAAPGHARTPPP